MGKAHVSRRDGYLRVLCFGETIVESLNPFLKELPSHPDFTAGVPILIEMLPSAKRVTLAKLATLANEAASSSMRSSPAAFLLHSETDLLYAKVFCDLCAESGLRVLAFRNETKAVGWLQEAYD